MKHYASIDRMLKHFRDDIPNTKIWKQTEEIKAYITLLNYRHKFILKNTHTQIIFITL